MNISDGFLKREWLIKANGQSASKKMKNIDSELDDWFCCGEFQSANDVTCEKCGKSRRIEEEEDKKFACVVCHEKIRNARLIHGANNHLVCCLECANRIFEGQRKCPDCDKKIDRFEKSFDILFSTF